MAQEKKTQENRGESQRSEDFFLPLTTRPLDHLITSLLPGNMRSAAPFRNPCKAVKEPDIIGMDSERRST
jgi:hypothetical protein